MSKSAGLGLPVDSSGNMDLKARFVSQHGVLHSYPLEVRDRIETEYDQLIKCKQESFFKAFLSMWPVWSSTLLMVLCIEFKPLMWLGFATESFTIFGAFILSMVYTIIAVGFNNRLVERRRQRERREIDQVFKKLIEARERASIADQFARDLDTLGAALGPRSDLMGLDELSIECQKKLDNQANGIRQLMSANPRSFLCDGDGQRYLREFFENIDVFRRLGIDIKEPVLMIRSES